MKAGRRLHWLSGIIGSGMLVYLYALRQSPTPVPFLQSSPQPLDTQQGASLHSAPSRVNTDPFLTSQATTALRPSVPQPDKLFAQEPRRETGGHVSLVPSGASLPAGVGEEGGGGGRGEGRTESEKRGGGESDKERGDGEEDKGGQEIGQTRKETREIDRDDGEDKPKKDENQQEERREERKENKLFNQEEIKIDQKKDKENEKENQNEGKTSAKEIKTKTSVKENEAENLAKENETKISVKENGKENLSKENVVKENVPDKLGKENETETQLKENESGILVKENGTEMKTITESYVDTGVNGTRRLMTQEEYLRVKKIHQDRISLVKERCEKFTPTATRGLTALINRGSHYKLGNKLFLPQDVVNSNFQIDERHRVTFCWQYKVGSTAWNAMFAYLLNQTSVIQRKTFYDMRKIMTVKTMREFKKSMDFYKFLIVREPLERLLSAYRDRIEDTSHRSWQRDNYVPKILKVTRPHLKSADIRVNGSLVVIPTFREFVEYLLVTPIGNYDPHWRPYWKHCAPCVVSFQAIGRAETQAQDIRFILEDSGLAREIDNTVLEKNAHHGRGSTHDLLVSYYSTLDISTLEKLYRRYEVDYFIFGYDIQLLLDELHPHRNIVFKSRF